MERYCPICVEVLSSDDVLDLLPKHLAKLEEMSREKDDGLMELLKDMSSNYMHKKCYIRYTNFLSVAKKVTEKILDEPDGAAFDSYLDLNQYFIMSEECVLCRNSSEDSGLVEASPNQLKRLRVASARKQDGLVERLQGAAKLHEDCYAAYAPCNERDDSGFSEKICPICDQDLLDDVLEVTPRKKVKLMTDKLVEKIRDVTEVQVHDRCFKSYTLAEDQKVDVKVDMNQDSEDEEKPTNSKRKAPMESDDTKTKRAVHQKVAAKKKPRGADNSRGRKAKVQVKVEEDLEDKTLIKDEVMPQETVEAKVEKLLEDDESQEDAKPKSKKNKPQEVDEPQSQEEEKLNSNKNKPLEDADPRPKNKRRRTEKKSPEKDVDEPPAKRVRKNSVEPALELVGDFFKSNADSEVYLSELLRDYERSRTKKPCYIYLVKKLKERFGDNLEVEKSKVGFLLKYKAKELEM